MNGTLIRDNIPGNIQREGDICNYAEIKSEALFNSLLRDKLVETVNTFLRVNTIEALSEVKVVVEAIATSAGVAFTEFYTKQMEELGGYAQGYISIQADYDTVTGYDDAQTKSSQK